MVHSKILCPIEVLGREPYQSTALIGGQRSGKTYIVALHTQNVKRSHKSRVIYVNLYDANGDAADDWGHADVCLTFHIKKMGVSQAKTAIEKVTAAVEQFNNDTNAIFVFDEWVAFTSKSNAWAKKASQENTAALVESKATQCYIAPEGIGTSAVELMNEVMSVSGELGSIGKKQLKAIWLLSPMLKASAVEPQGLVMKDLAPMVVAIPPDQSITWEHPTTGIVQEITFDDAGYRASMVNLGLMPIEKVPHMEVDRMMCLKNTWYSLDNLPKLEQRSEVKSPSPSIAPSSSSESKPINTDVPLYLEASTHSGDAFDYDALGIAPEPYHSRYKEWFEWQRTQINDGLEISSEVETQSINDYPDGLDRYPLVITIWDYLHGKDPRSFKQINDAMRAKGKIPEDILMAKVPNSESYRDALKAVVTFGVSKRYLRQVSEDAYESVKKH